MENLPSGVFIMNENKCPLQNIEHIKHFLVASLKHLTLLHNLKAPQCFSMRFFRKRAARVWLSTVHTFYTINKQLEDNMNATYETSLFIFNKLLSSITCSTVLPGKRLCANIQPTTDSGKCNNE